MKLALICSSGGHLVELLPVGNALKEYNKFWVTFFSEITKKTLIGEKFYFVVDPRRNLLRFLILFLQSLIIFLKEKPDVVITTGAGVAIPFCIISKFFGKKVIFIESLCRTKSPSLTGRILYYFSDLFFVQWESNLKFYGKKAKFVGTLF